KLTRDVPEGNDLGYEPKGDGVRGVVVRDGDEIERGSRNEKPLTRDVPELVVLDGEIVIPSDKGLDFDALQLRMHPAASRVNKLAAEIPASFVAFDLLALGDDDLTKEPFAKR